MILPLVLFVSGLVVVGKAADFLVDGASSIAARAKIAPIVIGLTIVAFGTSAPELVVSVTGALQGSTQLAFGNVVGSNIFNILIILAIASIIHPLRIHSNTVWKEIPLSVLGAIAVFVLGLQYVFDYGRIPDGGIRPEAVLGTISFSNGLILLMFFAVFLYYTFGIAKIQNDGGDQITMHSIPVSFFMALAGLAGLVLGSRLVVDNAVILAQAIGLSEKVIALTLIAAGTGLPELATSVAAARKGQADIAVGNIVGSNIFNIFLILGITALVKPVQVTGVDIIDLGVMVAASIFLFLCTFLLHKKHVDRWEGITMLIAYGVYLAYLFVR
ncbi:MAG: calcium/sodium antiporter [Patescibacteria group bacterium]|nr:calcium/sodium antiporter [Patescibacteria group bacterium]